MKIFLAGATGAVGKRLAPLLIKAGHRVTGTTRSAAKGETLSAAGVEPVIVDVFDAEGFSKAVLTARPDIVVHQLTDLPLGLDPTQMTEGTRRNARMRREGTKKPGRRRAGLDRATAYRAKYCLDVRPGPGATL
jgi:nucleoside-diphosphate-sugar epimerase